MTSSSGFPASAAFWWFFEYLNRYVWNWYYHGVGVMGAGEYAFFATCSFATVLPAVLKAFRKAQPEAELTFHEGLLVQALVGAFVSYLAWMWMLAHYPATKISVFVFLTPVFALLFGALWLGEPVTPGLVAALVLVAAGIVLVNRRPAG